MGMLCVMYGHNMSKPDYELLLQEAAEQFSLAHPSGIDLLPMYWRGCLTQPTSWISYQLWSKQTGLQFWHQRSHGQRSAQPRTAGLVAYTR